MRHTFRLVAGHVALDFANTLDYRYDPNRLIELLPTYESYMTFAEESGMISSRQASKLLAQTSRRDAQRTLRQVITLREALYFLFLAVARGRSPDATRLRTLNEFLSRASVPEVIEWRRGEFLRGRRDVAETPGGSLWTVGEAATNLLLSPDRLYIRECTDPSCRWLFLDRSKNHSRRWCDMRLCGNRSKAQRFHARQRGVT